MKKCIVLVLLIVGLAGCNKGPELPIPKEQMALILKDMLVAEAAMRRVTRSTKDSLEKVYYNQIYKIHGVDSAELATCFQMMQEDPELSLDLYRQAETILVDLETAGKAQKESDKKEKDKKEEKR